MNDTKPKTPGRTYNIKRQELAADGQKKWTLLGRVFVRDDGTGGAVYVGEGDAQRVLALSRPTSGRGGRPGRLVNRPRSGSERR